jgi:hypothetical protein
MELLVVLAIIALLMYHPADNERVRNLGSFNQTLMRIIA